MVRRITTALSVTMFILIGDVVYSSGSLNATFSNMEEKYFPVLDLKDLGPSPAGRLSYEHRISII